MRLGTIDLRGTARAAIADGDEWVVLDAADIGELAARADWHSATQRALDEPGRERVTDPALLRPVLRPAKVLCCGLNYADHIRETGREVPRYPTLFAKFADTLTDPSADINVFGSTQVDWEAELAVVVGSPVRRADREAAADAILGYTVANDVSARDWQSRTLQWLQGKAFDASTPIGPVIVTPDEFDPVAGARIGAAVDGETVQDGNTRELVFDAAALVAYVSQFTRLDAGDILLTGTPGGVGSGREPQRFLGDGQVLTTWIDGIGQLRNRVRIHPGAAAA